MKSKTTKISARDAQPRQQTDPKPIAESIQKPQKDRELWEAFNLAKNNPDRGGGILYCIRYGSERLKAHQDTLISALQAMPLEIIEVENQLGIKIKPDMTESKRETLLIMLEELSVVNEALEYVQAGLGDLGSLDKLKTALQGTYFNLYDSRALTDAYNFVSMSIPEIVRDIRHSDTHNDVLSSAERKILDELMTFAIRQERILNKPHRVVG